MRAVVLFFVIGASLMKGVDVLAQQQTSVTVKVHNNQGSSISLYKVENGTAKRLTFRWPKPENADTCMFVFPLDKEAVFYISKTGGKSASLQHVLFVKPGDQIQVDAFASKMTFDFDSCVVQSPNAETLLLSQWLAVVNDYCALGNKRAQRDEFIAGYTQFVQKGNALKKMAVLPNKNFNRMFRNKIDAELLYPKAAAYFNFTHRMNSINDTAVAHQPFYQSLKGKQFCQAGILESEYGLDLMRFTMGYNALQAGKSQQQMLATSIVAKAKAQCNDTVRGALVGQYMLGATNYEQFVKEIVPFKKSILAANLGDAYQRKLDEMTLFAKGLAGYNFKLPDTKNKIYTLADFKGKLVVMDIWAMWCAPCLAEKPFFQEIEESYKNDKRLVFVSVSVDGNAKKEPWKKFVAKKGWHGIELLSDHDKSIMKYYKIEGIPRFLIFDAEGKIVTVDAPRPSDSRFKELIEQALSEKKQLDDTLL